MTRNVTYWENDSLLTEYLRKRHLSVSLPYVSVWEITKHQNNVLAKKNTCFWYKNRAIYTTRNKSGFREESRGSDSSPLIIYASDYLFIHLSSHLLYFHLSDWSARRREAWKEKKTRPGLIQHLYPVTVTSGEFLQATLGAGVCSSRAQIKKMGMATAGGNRNP